MRQHLRFTLALLLTVSVSLAAFSMFQAAVLDGVRAYVKGEGLYSKAQKDAVFQLQLFKDTGDRQHFRAAIAHLDVPLGDRQARLALWADPVDRSAAYAGFKRGLNHPEDIRTMIWFFVSFQNFPYVKEAIEIWGESDDLVMQIRERALDLRAAYEANDAAAVAALTFEIADLNTRAASKQIEFSAVLSEGARVGKAILMSGGLVVMALTLLGAWVGIRRIFKEIEGQEREREANREQLRKSEERFDLAMNAANSDGLWDWDLQANSVYYSPLWKSMLGYEAHELPDTFEIWESLVDEEGRARVNTLIDDCKNRKANGFSAEVKMRHKDGHWVDILTRSVVMRDENNRAYRMVGTHTDITDVKRQQTELRQLNTNLNEQVRAQTKDLLAAKDSAESASRAKSAFLANMSHEIRTPMNGILGMVELITKTDLSTDQRKMLSTVQASSETLLRIIDDILDISKIEAGKLSLAPTRTVVRDMCEDVLLTLRPIATARNVKLRFTHMETPFAIQADEMRLRQILMNLLNNAIKFSDAEQTGRNGYVDLHVETVNDDMLRMTITDNGIGIDKAVLTKLFQPFTQAEAETTRSFGGTGLGLSICQSLVDMMGGRIKVASALGAGSTFTVEIPVSQLEHSGVTQQLADEHVLAFVSEATTVEVVSSCLGHMGATVQAFSSREELLEVLRNRPETFNPVVLLGMDGRTRTEKLYQDILSEFGELRYILLTSDTVSQELLNAENTVKIYRYPILPSYLENGMLRLTNSAPDQAAGTTRQSSQNVTAFDQCSLLLVEDNVVNQQVITAQLKRLGASVDVASNGVDGFKRWLEGSYDLVLTDCHMPEMDGFEMVGQIRSVEASTGRDASAVVAITANALSGEAEKCIAAGMDDYLSKPVKLADLQACLQRWLIDGPSFAPS